jgi:ABC-2 type transport system permease protein
MKKGSSYFKLYKSFFRASLISDFEFRFNFLFRLITDVFWYGAQILTFEILFLHTQQIGHWNLPQTRIFLGLLFVVDALFMVLFHDNLSAFHEKVRRGQLDLLLAKPINSQFMISLQRVGTSLIGNLLIALMYLSWTLYQYPDFSPIRLLWLLILIPCGLTCFYVFRFMMAATAIFFTKSDNLDYLWYQIYKLGLRPDSIYSPWLRYLVLSAIPVGVIASVPARAVIDEPNYLLFIWVICWSLFLLWISTKFWSYCLKHYTSASS